MRASEVTGTITMEDGSEVQFRISLDGIQHWGNSNEKMGEAVDATEAMAEALYESMTEEG